MRFLNVNYSVVLSNWGVWNIKNKTKYQRQITWRRTTWLWSRFDYQRIGYPCAHLKCARQAIGIPCRVRVFLYSTALCRCGDMPSQINSH